MTEQRQAEAPGAEKATIAVSMALRVLAPFAAGYFLTYLLRAVNAVVAPDLVGELSLSAADLGLLTASYLGAFALFQLPLGVLLDRYGPRRVQAALFSIAATGCALFAAGSDALTLTLARAMIGLGFAGGLMSSFKAIVLWIPEPRRALANAGVMSFGALGLLTATAPTELAASMMGWRMVFVVLAALTIGVAMVILTVVPERKAESAAETLREQVRQLAAIFRDRAFLAIAPLIATTAGTHIAIQTLWAGPWLRDVAQLDRAGVASSLFIIGVAFFVGILSSGAIADWFVRRGFSELTVMTGFLILFFASQTGIVLELHELHLAIWFAFGMSGQVAILAYPWLSTRFGTKLSGRAQTAMNLLIFLAAFAVQYAIGGIIALFPPGSAGGYDPRAYQVAFGIFLALQVLCFGLYLANRELFRKPTS
ncbi:MAG TPA: MFS transporter [Hyphomicrobiaceae bacterium]|nr:MFS transporter [Hyphomicrobiaceae bacterium]